MAVFGLFQIKAITTEPDEYYIETLSHVHFLHLSSFSQSSTRTASLSYGRTMVKVEPCHTFTLGPDKAVMLLDNFFSNSQTPSPFS